MATKPTTAVAPAADAPEETPLASARHSGFAPAAQGGVAPPLPHRPTSFEEAFRLTAPQREALTRDQFVSTGPFDVMYAIKVALGTAARLDELRDVIAVRFGEELEQIDQISTLARAAGHAASLLRATLAPPEKVQGVYERGLTVRRRLTSELTNLVNLNLISPQALKRLTGSVGHLNVVQDIQTIITMVTEAGPDVVERLVTTSEELAEYQQLASELLQLSAASDGDGPTTEQARETFQRALTLFINAYSEAERVVMFLYWKDKAYRQLVPSLYASSPKGPKESSGAPSSEPLDAGFDSDSAFDRDGALSTDTATGSLTTELEASVPGARGGSPFAPSQK